MRLLFTVPNIKDVDIMIYIEQVNRLLYAWELRIWSSFQISVSTTAEVKFLGYIKNASSLVAFGTSFWAILPRETPYSWKIFEYMKPVLNNADVFLSDLHIWSETINTKNERIQTVVSKKFKYYERYRELFYNTGNCET